eukprot:COSAG05_NODE_7081_length_858_cov_1.301713_1_plen_108_part_00
MTQLAQAATRLLDLVLLAAILRGLPERMATLFHLSNLARAARAACRLSLARLAGAGYVVSQAHPERKDWPVRGPPYMGRAYSARFQALVRPAGRPAPISAAIGAKLP